MAPLMAILPSTALLLVEVSGYAPVFRISHSAREIRNWLAVLTVIRKDRIIDYISSVFAK